MGRAGAWIGTAVAGAVALWLLLAHGSANVGRVLSTDLGVHADFDTFHRSAVALLHGEPIYDTGAHLANLNPPVWTVLLAPLGLLPPLTAYRVFGVLTAVLVVGAGLLVAHELGVAARARVLVSVAVLLSSPLLGTVALGQVYGVLAAGIAAAWVLWQRGRPGWAGVLLGLMVAIKPTLAPLLLWPVAGRNWRTFGAAVAGLAAATLAGLVVAGPHATWRWLQVVDAERLSTFGDNASLPSFVARLGGPAWIGYLLGAALVVLTLRRVHHDAGPWALTAATLLLSPVAWHNYLVLCVPGVFVLVRRGRTATVALLLTLPLIGVEWGMHLWLGDGVLDRLGRSLYCFVLLAWWAALTFDAEGTDGAAVRPAASAAPRGAGRPSLGTAWRRAGW